MVSTPPISYTHDFNNDPAGNPDVAELQSALDHVAARFSSLLSALDVSTREDDTLNDALVRLRNLHPEVSLALAAAGISVVEECRTVAVANVDVATGGLLTIEGVATDPNDRVALTAQTDPIENGIWIASAGAWSRSADMDDAGDFPDDRQVVFGIAEGVYGGSAWVILKVAPDVGTDAITITQLFRLISDSSIGTSQLIDLAVTTAKLADLAVTTAKLADLAVTTAKIADLAVTTGKIADDAVTPAKMAHVGAYSLLVNATAGSATLAEAPVDDLLVLADGSTTRRDVSARFAEYANVRDYGAVGDGTTDDRDAIQAAFNSGKNVIFPDGTYAMGASATFASNERRLIGLGGAVIKHAAGSVLADLIICSGTGQEVRGITFDGNAANVTGTPGFAYGMLRFNTTSVAPTVEGCTFRNSIAGGLVIRGETGGTPATIRDANVVNNRFDDVRELACLLHVGPYATNIIGNRFRGLRKGGIRIYDFDSKYIRVIGNYVEFTSSVALSGDCLGIELNSLTEFASGGGDRIVVANNTVIGSQAGGSVPIWAISLDGCNQAVVVGNTCRHNLLWGIEIVRGQCTVVSNTIEGVANDVEAAGIILNGVGGPPKACVIANNVVSDCQKAGIRLFTTGSVQHLIQGNSLEDCDLPFSMSGGCDNCIIRGNVIGPRLDGVNGPALTTADSVEALTYEDNDHRYEALGYGWTLPITGSRWVVRGNRFRGGGVASHCIEIASGSHGRAVIQNNLIKNYNANGIKTDASSGKNVVGGNCYETVTTPSTLAGTDTAYDNVDQT